MRERGRERGSEYGLRFSDVYDLQVFRMARLSQAVPASIEVAKLYTAQ
jgi:hypothetical protein